MANPYMSITIIWLGWVQTLFQSFYQRGGNQILFLFFQSDPKLQDMLANIEPEMVKLLFWENSLS